MKNNLNKKTHNNQCKNFSYKCHFLRYGNFGLKALDKGLILEKDIFFIQRYLSKNIKISKNKNSAKFWTLLQVTGTHTQLSPESRMGKGKGPISSKIANIKAGQILFEFAGLNKHEVNNLFNGLKTKVPFGLKILK